jgi:hypothetical protein
MTDPALAADRRQATVSYTTLRDTIGAMASD